MGITVGTAPDSWAPGVTTVAQQQPPRVRGGRREMTRGFRLALVPMPGQATLARSPSYPH